MKIKWGLMIFLSSLMLCGGLLWFILFRGFIIDATVLSIAFLEETQGTTELAKARNQNVLAPARETLSPNLVETTVTFISQYEVVIEYKYDGENEIRKIYVEKEKIDNISVGDTFKFSDKKYNLDRLYIEK